MAFEVKLKHLKISPRKVRLVADMIRGKKIDEAQAILGFAVKKGADPILKLLNSAVANAKNNSKSFGCPWNRRRSLVINELIINGV